MKRLLDKMTPYEFGNKYFEDYTKEETTVTNNESQVELLFMFH